MPLPHSLPAPGRARLAVRVTATAVLIAAGTPLAGQAPGEGRRAADPAPSPVLREGYAMGTKLRVELPGGGTRAERLGASEAVFREVERMESLLSTWRGDTPLARLNRAPVGEPAALPGELQDLLLRTMAWSERTEGAFDPRIGALVDAWDLRGTGRLPSDPALGAALAATGAKGLTLSEGGLTRHHPGAWLDAGGFGKGAALATAADTLRGRGTASALVDLGGQLLALGTPADDARGWPIAVTHPEERERPVLELRIRDASVATSGNAQRGIDVDGGRLGHLLDPRTGRPAPSWGSVTVVSADPLEADILATALYVLGPEAGMRLARRLPDTGVLFLAAGTSNLEASWNPAMERWLPASTPSSTLAPAPGAHR